MANYKYALQDGAKLDFDKYKAENILLVSFDEYDKFQSQCDRTMVGFVKPQSSDDMTLTQHPIQCFYGVKASSDKSTSLAQVSHHEKRKGGNRKNLFYQHTPNEDSDILITSINSDPNSSWKANPCMLTKKHPDYKQCLDLKKTQNLNLAQTSQTVRVEDAMEQITKWKKQYSRPEDIPDSEIPASFDFRNIEGMDLT